MGMDAGAGANRHRGWRPILEGETGAAAQEAIADIAGALVAAHNVPPASLARGGAGLALLFAFLARARPGEGHEERASAHLDAAIDALATQVMDDSLYAGFTGVAWVTEVLLLTLPDDGGGGDSDGDGDGDDLNEDVDEALLELLARSPWRRDCDLVSGLAGHAVYALERLRRPSARECLERILDRLEESAERRDGGARGDGRGRDRRRSRARAARPGGPLGPRPPARRGPRPLALSDPGPRRHRAPPRAVRLVLR